MRRSLSVAAIALIATLTGLGPSVQRADATEARYGEVARFGGYDQTGKVPGKFVRPVGFAVEPEDPTTKEANGVYVLDLIRNDIQKKGELGEGKAFLEYRLQKLSSAGAVLGSVVFTEPYTDTEKFLDGHPLFGLAVDPAGKRIYAIVESIVKEEENEGVPVVDEIVAWSTEPTAKGELVAASGFPADPVTKSASLIAGQAVLEPSSTEAGKDLFLPNGVAVSQESGDVVVEAQQGVEKQAGGPTTLVEVAPGSGSVVRRWEAEKVAPERQQGDGLFASTEGSGGFGLDLYSSPDAIARLATVSSGLGSEALLAEDKSEGKNRDEAVSIDLINTPNVSSAKEIHSIYMFTAGSPVVQLNGGGHLYAALFAHEAGGPVPAQQGQVEPWMAWDGGKTPSELWMAGREGNFDDEWAHMGIRLFEADGRIVYTLGGGEAKHQGESQSGTCDIDFAKVSLAAGAEGAVFALTQPNFEAVGVNKQKITTDDEVIEFAPGAPHPCPGVSHDVQVNGEEVHVAGGASVPTATVNAGVETKFDAISLDQPLSWSPPGIFVWKPEPLEWVPFAFEWGWDFQKEPTAGATKEGYTEVQKMRANGNGEYLWPKPETEHEYTKAGTYEARLRVYGDYGTTVFPIKVIVAGGSPPTASFVPPAHIVAGVPAAFDAAASTPAPGGPTIEDYHWEFGDGSPAVNTNQRVESHRFAKAGEYTVTLTVRDNEGSERDASVPQRVVVGPAPSLGQPVIENTLGAPPAQEMPTGLASASTIVGPTTKTPSANAPVVKKKPLTRAQKLAAALRACKKRKARKRRGSCERVAHSRYGSAAHRGRKHK